MNQFKQFLSLTAAFLIISSCISAQALISSKELKKIMNKKEVVIISARKGDDYNKVHINGAVNIYPGTLYKPGDVKGLLKSNDEIAAILGQKGIDTEKTLVVYDGGMSVASGRLFWILKYLGCQDVKILNGELPAWRKNRMPLTKNPTNIKSTTFTLNADKSITADQSYVQTHLNKPGVLLVDARSKDEYDGVKGETSRKGHIPGAIHFEYKKVLNENGTFKSKDELLKLFNDAGITSDKEIILYCATSERTGIVFLALKEILDYPNVRVYDGAFYEWSANADNKVN